MLINIISVSLINKLSRLTVPLQWERCRHTKHWNPKYKEARRKKVIRFDFPEFESNTDDSQDRRRIKMKERGIFPQKQLFERPMYLSCTGNVFEPYIPPEGDGKFSSISKIGAKQNVEFLLKKTKSHQALRKIRKYEEEFNLNEFPDQVTDVYIMAHQALARHDKEELTDLVTEKLYPEMIYNLEDKTVEWKFINSLEPARVVHARCTSLITDNNVFAQVTVRLHTQQILAVYDRFGRLMDGTEMLKKDVFEYVVVEKHISNEYGRWRLHSKIVPSWFPPKQYINKSFVIN